MFKFVGFLVIMGFALYGARLFVMRYVGAKAQPPHPGPLPRGERE